MNDLVHPAESVAALSDYPTDELKRMLAQAVELTAQHVARMAEIWRELERRGEDMTHLRSGIAAYLPAIAAGRLVPEAVVKLAGNRTALRAVALLTRDEQIRLLERGALDVRRAGDVIDHVPLSRLSASDVARAIDTVAGRVRSPAEQGAIRKRTRQQGRTCRIVVLLTEDQHARLLSKARQLNVTASHLVVDAMRKEELI